MSARLAKMRVWVAAIYLLAALAADGLHVHPTSRDRHCGGCPPTPRVDFTHWGHDSGGKQLRGKTPRATVDALDCPACQFQAQKSIAVSLSPQTGWEPLGDIVCIASLAGPACFRALLPPIRAPPLNA